MLSSFPMDHLAPLRIRSLDFRILFHVLEALGDPLTVTKNLALNTCAQNLSDTWRSSHPLLPSRVQLLSRACLIPNPPKHLGRQISSHSTNWVFVSPQVKFPLTLSRELHVPLGRVWVYIMYMRMACARL
ncbi:hypothetical protein Nepgr_011684 [Nepenthes gracilis]|uniref:Uncharacterized protein n=1 Tax=Nepenthes gracilis TaxID=150966 RepID=A0AAD3SEL6_NEPGR|nr:hypothetical protein Nepgr_011684 [Nepenthes gracilis]